MRVSAIGLLCPSDHAISTCLNPSLTPYLNYSNPFETQGTKNIGARWSAGGGSDVHTPGAATPRGNAENTKENQVNPKGCTSPKPHKLTHCPNSSRTPQVSTANTSKSTKSRSVLASPAHSTRLGTSPTTAPRRANRLFRLHFFSFCRFATQQL
jgi:hypothetical protein